MKELEHCIYIEIKGIVGQCDKCNSKDVYHKVVDLA